VVSGATRRKRRAPLGDGGAFLFFIYVDADPQSHEPRTRRYLLGLGPSEKFAPKTGWSQMLGAFYCRRFNLDSCRH
jgi:hypothetical protein